MFSNNFLFTKLFSNFLSIRRTENRVLLFLVLAISAALLSSCGKTENNEPKNINQVPDSIMIDNEMKKMFGNQLKVILSGNFDIDSLPETAAGIEINESNNWGIKFIFFKVQDSKLFKIYESNLLDGSFKDCLVETKRLDGWNHDLIYYNSEDYFWGSGGGEVFSYLVDLVEQKIYYAHLFSEMRKPVELFLSKNIENKNLKSFFILEFKKDYPGLRLSSQDISLDY